MRRICTVELYFSDSVFATSMKKLSEEFNEKHAEKLKVVTMSINLNRKTEPHLDWSATIEDLLLTHFSICINILGNMDGVRLTNFKEAIAHYGIESLRNYKEFENVSNYNLMRYKNVLSNLDDIVMDDIPIRYSELANNRDIRERIISLLLFYTCDFTIVFFDSFATDRMPNHVLLTVDRFINIDGIDDDISSRLIQNHTYIRIGRVFFVQVCMLGNEGFEQSVKENIHNAFKDTYSTTGNNPILFVVPLFASSDKAKASTILFLQKLFI